VATQTIPLKKSWPIAIATHKTAEGTAIIQITELQFAMDPAQGTKFYLQDVTEQHPQK